MTQQTVRESEHDKVYGSSFALYDASALREFLEPFKVRFQANALDARALFAGRRCLDAGCGNGRGSLFMLENGAAHVTGVDISEQNIESTRRNLSDFGFANFECRQSSLEKLPFEDGQFEFVWCNGVIMHTASPDVCIAELARVTRVKGGLWLYVYGAGGIYWHFVKEFRAMLARVSVDQLIASLKLFGYPVRFIAEYVDDWKTPYLRTYTDRAVRSKLAELGFVDINRALHGMSYDTSARIAKYPQESRVLGEGDLRYVAVRGPGKGSSGESLNVNHIDDAAADPVAVELFGADLERLRKRVAGNDLAAIAACAVLQRYLRENVMSIATPIDVDAMARHMKETLALLDQLAPAR
jgi:ubiquinone/menaquinone biosynthesis C-methylase UbiE